MLFTTVPATEPSIKLSSVAVAVTATSSLILGLVKVLFVKVSEPASVARSASVTAVLNCAIVPDTVFEPRATVLFVKVSEPAREATSASLTAVFN